jgi:hypothetical protein
MKLRLQVPNLVDSVCHLFVLLLPGIKKTIGLHGILVVLLYPPRCQWGAYYNGPNLKVGNTNSTQGILCEVFTENLKCLPTVTSRIIVDRPSQVYFHSYFTLDTFNIHNQFNCVRHC